MQNSIPFFSLKRQWPALKSKIESSMSKVLDSQQYIGGEFVSSFEKKLASYVGAKHVIGCNSGTDALWLALRALKTPRNSIVLTTPFSFIASCSEIIDHGAHPVFIDVEEDTFNISPSLLKDWLCKNAKLSENGAVHKSLDMPIVGIIAVNIFGQCANYEEILKIAKEYGLWVIEDAAQSIGSEVMAKKSGTFGDIGCFSFYPTKNLGAYGDAGALVTNNPDLAEKILTLRHHGRVGSVGYNYVEYGVNSRLDALQAVVLNEKLDYLDQWNNQRREIASLYTKALKNIPFLKTPSEKMGKHTFHQYSIVLDEKLGNTFRSELVAYLTSKGIGTNVFYPKSFPEIGFLNQIKELFNPCPISKKLTSSILALPIWPELSAEEVSYICNQIIDFMKPYSNVTSAPSKKCCSSLHK